MKCSYNDDLNNAKYDFYSLLNEQLTLGDIEINRKIHDPLAKMVEVDSESGMSCWVELIDNFGFERRSQDFTEYMLEKLINVNGIEWTLRFLDSFFILKDRLFRQVGTIPYSFIRRLFEAKRDIELLDYLNLLCENVSAKRILSSQNFREYLMNQPSRYRAATATVFRMQEFVRWFRTHLFDVDSRQAIMQWLDAAVDRWEKYNEAYVPLEIVCNKFIPEILPFVFTPKEQIQHPSKINYIFNELQEISNDSTEFLIRRVRLTGQIIKELNKKYPYVSIFSQRKDKNGVISSFIAKQSDEYYILPPLFRIDSTLNVICGFSESKDNQHLFYLLNRQFPKLFEAPRDEYQVFSTNIGLIFYVIDPNNIHSQQYAKMRSIILNRMADVSDTVLLIRSIIADITKFVSEVEDCLLPSLIELMQKKEQVLPRILVSYDQLNQYRSDIYKYMLDTGEASSRWICEVRMYDIIRAAFPDAVFQARPLWLDMQSYDVYVKSKKVAFEYQGFQHYEPVDFFGGIEGLKYRRELDKRKMDLSIQNGVTLIYWKYDEPLTEAALHRKLKLANIEV